MGFIKNIEFTIHGYDDFIENVLPQLDEICDATIADKEGHFQIAVMEAVNNAARYSTSGLDNAEIGLKITIFEHDIKAVISSVTKDFDVKGFRDKIKEIGQDKNWRRKNFGEFKSDRLSGRGIWLMLEACEYLYIDTADKTVTLCVSYPMQKQLITRNIGILASRFCIKENGVIY